MFILLLIGDNKLKQLNKEILLQEKIISDNGFDRKNGILQLEFLSLRMESVKLTGNKQELESVYNGIRSLLKDESVRKISDSLAFNKLDSLVKIRNGLK